ncbi:MAG: HEAT repeat domain-containing protein [Deltaproteobacteria bacterium]|nr:HEAT repeat domain-containing protein [Deltaproteobacteria bacterium]
MGVLVSLWVGLLAAPMPAGAAATGADERGAIEVLCLLASPTDAVVVAGIEAAKASKSLLYEAPLLALMQRPGAVTLRAKAAEALGALDWPEDAGDLQARLEALGLAATLAQTEIRHAAIAALGKFPTPEAQKALRQRLLATTDPEAVARIQTALAEMRQPAVLERLSVWMGRPPAAGTLLGVPDTWSVALAARRLLAEPKAESVGAIADVLFAAPDPAAVRPLVAFAARASTRVVRLRALEHMAAAPMPVDVPALMALLADPDREFRQSGLRALAVHADAAVADALAAYMLVESAPELLRTAAAALRRQSTEDLAAATLPRLQSANGYALELLVFLVRERQGEVVLWPKVVALARLPGDEALRAVVAEDAAVRERVLLPHLQDPTLTAAERLAVVRGLADIHDVATTRALLALVTAAADPSVIREVGAAAPDPAPVELWDRLADVVDNGGTEQRAAAYAVLARATAEPGRRSLIKAIESEAEVSLLTDLLAATGERAEPEVVAAVATRLGDDQDPRIAKAAIHWLRRVADPTLAPRYVLWIHRGPTAGDGGLVDETAFEALAALPPPAAENGLREVVSDPGARRALRLRAVELLGERGARDDLGLLEATAKTDDRELKAAAKNAMHRLAPDLQAEWDGWGRYPLVLTSSAFGTALLLLSTQIAEELSEAGQSKRKVLLGVGGAALGASTSFLLTLNTDVSLGEAGYYTTLGLWGTTGGYSLARVAGLGVREKTGPLWAAIGGELLGVGVGALTLRPARFSIADVVLTNATATSLGVGALGAAYLGRLGGGTAGAADVFTLGGLAAVAPLAVLSPRLHLDGEQLFGFGTSIAFATWLGAFAPKALVRKEDAKPGDTLAGIGLGQAVGWAGGLVLSQVTTFGGAQVAWATLGALSGAGLGTGIGLSDLRLRGRPTYGLLEGGTLLGAGVLTWIGPRLDFSATDVGLITLMTLGGALTGARVPAQVAENVNVAGVDETAGRQKKWGGSLVGGTLGLYAGLGASQLVELSGGELLMTAAGATVLGTGGAGISLLLPEVGGGQFSNMFSAGAAIGAVGLGAFLAPRLRYEPADIALGLSTGSLGAFLGSFVPAYRTAAHDKLPVGEQTGGAMAGGALGLVFAGAVSQFTDVEPYRVLRVDLGALGGMAFGSGLGLLLPASVSHGEGRRTTVALMQAGTALGYGIATLTERRTEYSGADRYHLALASAFGAFHGSLIPAAWRAPTDPIALHEKTGGALVGLASGAAAARLAIYLGPKDAADVTEVGLWDLYGTAIGTGLAGLSTLDRRGRTVAVGASGLVGLGAGELIAGHTTFTPSDLYLVSTLTTLGAVAGLGLPYWVREGDPDLEAGAAGASVAAGAFGLAGLGLSQLVDYDPMDLPEVLLTSATLSAGLWGVGRARVHKSARTRYRLQDLGWIAGTGAGLWAAPRTAYSEDDLWWVAYGAGLGAWVGGLVPTALHGRGADAAQRGGGATSGAALGALAFATAAQWWELPKSFAFGAAGLSTATTLVGSGLGVLQVPGKPQQQALAMQLAAVSGSLAAGLVMPKAELGVAEAATIVTDAGLGAWFGRFAPAALGVERARRERGGALAGTGAGMLLGYGASQLLHPTVSDNVEVTAYSGVGSAIGTGLGLLLDLDGVATTRSLEAAGIAGFALGTGVARFTDFKAADAGVMAAASGWGSWHGLWLGDVLARSGSERARRRAGGALLGAGVGVTAGAVLSQLTDESGDLLAEASVMMGAGNMIGTGGGYLLQLDPGLRTGLFEAGGLAGIVGGLTLGRRTEYSRNDVILVGMSGLFGGLHGTLLSGIIHDDASEQATWGGFLAGTGLGLLGGMAVAERLELGAEDLAELTLVTAAGDAVGLGAAAWLELDTRSTFGLIEASGLGLAALGLLTADQTSFDRGDRVLTAYGALYGAWLGAYAPRMWQEAEPAGSQTGTGILLGAGVGALGAGVLSQVTDYRLADVAEIAFGTTTSSVLGAGLGLVLDPGGDLWVPLMEGVGFAGTLAVGYLAPRTSYTASDAVLGGLAAAYGLYQGAGLSYLAKAKDEQVAGAMLAATAAGTLAGSYLAPYVHLSGTDVLMLLAGSAWGVWIGVWTAAAIDERQEGSLDRSVVSLGVGTTAVATDVTLVATSVAISKLVKMPPKQFAWVSVGGGLGLVAGLSASNLVQSRLSPKLGIAAGSVAGLAAGAVATSFFDWQPAEEAAGMADAGSSATRLFGWLPQVDLWFPGVVVEPAGDREGLSPVQGSKILLQITGFLR